MEWILKLAAAGDEGPCVEIMEISKPDDLGDIANLGLTLTEAKQLLAWVQREMSAARGREHAVRRPVCPTTGIPRSGRTGTERSLRAWRWEIRSLLRCLSVECEYLPVVRAVREAAAVPGGHCGTPARQVAAIAVESAIHRGRRIAVRDADLPKSQNSASRVAQHKTSGDTTRHVDP